MISKVLSKELERQYALVAENIRETSAAYGHNSPARYLADYAPRMKSQIRTLLSLIETQNLSGGRLLSIGGWPGISGIVLHRMTGIEVTLIDHPAVLREDVSAFYRANGLQTVPYDFAESVHAPIPVSGSFDLIECCQCIEHWNFNPVYAFRDIFSRVLNVPGFMLVTVPNAVNLYRRLFTFFGMSPYPRMSSFIDVAEGVPGAEVSPHWREYLRQDIPLLIEYTGGECISLEMKQHKLLYTMSIFQRIHQALHNLHPGLRSTIEVVAQRKQ